MTNLEFRALRKRLGLTQAQLAERLGIGPRQIWEYESGNTTVPKMTELAMVTIQNRMTPHG